MLVPEPKLKVRIMNAINWTVLCVKLPGQCVWNSLHGLVISVLYELFELLVQQAFDGSANTLS